MRLKITKINANNENHLQEILGASGFKGYGYYEDLCEFITGDMDYHTLDEQQRNTFSLMLQSLVFDGFGVEVII